VFLFVSLFKPLILGDNENFVEANFSVTPHHIQPEWYFLFSYAILRSIPNKLGGVIALAASVGILFIIPWIRTIKKENTIFLKSKFLFWTLIFSTVLLTWIGACPVEYPFLMIGQIFSIIYFSILF